VAVRRGHYPLLRRDHLCRLRTSVVESWPRVTSKRLSADLLKVAQGSYDFSTLEHLMTVPGQDAGEDE
jgi:hypothetical protein